MKHVRSLASLKMVAAVATVAAIAVTAQGCSSTQVRESRKKRDTAVSRFGMFCDFVKSDAILETEVELNVRMSDRCDPARPFSISSYNTANDVHGVLFCCSLDPEKAKARATVVPAPAPTIGTAAGAPTKRPEGTTPAPAPAAH